MSSFPRQYNGRYFDGQTPQPRSAKIHLTEEKLILTFDNGKSRSWAYAQLKLMTAHGHGKSVQIAHIDPNSPRPSEEILEVPDPNFIKAIEATSRVAFRTKLEQLVPRKMKWLVYASTGVFIILIFLVIWEGILPVISVLVADHIPPSWEEKIGESTLPYFIGSNPTPTPPKVRRALDAISERLLKTIPNQPYTFRIYVMDVPIVNALALPGGYIVVFQGLINMTQTPEELAGILAHEYQHVLKHHATRGLLRQYALAAVLNLLGSGSNFMELILGVAGTVESLRHSRNLEAEADKEGMKMIIAAGINPNEMVSVYKKLKQEEEKGIEKIKDTMELDEESDAKKWLDLLSTHPDTGNRIEQLAQMAQAAQVNAQPLLPDLDWTTLHKKFDKKKRKTE